MFDKFNRPRWGEKLLQIKYVYADYTQPTGYGKKIIVNLCNITGKWQGNQNLAISKKYKKAKKEFSKWFKKSKKDQSTIPFQLGSVQLVDVTQRGWVFDRNKEANLWVANLLGLNGEPRGYTYPFRIGAVKKGLKRIASFAKHHEATIHMPRIGCQPTEGGKWDVVESQIKEEIILQNVPVVVYDIE